MRRIWEVASTEVYSDPRGDLVEDREQWAWLLRQSHLRFGTDLTSWLRCLRMCGTRIRRGAKGGWQLAFDVDPGGIGWRAQDRQEFDAEAKAMRERMTREGASYAKVVGMLLKEMP